MSKKARRRPSWMKPKKRKIRGILYRMPYNKYWTVDFYQWFDSLNYKGI